MSNPALTRADFQRLADLRLDEAKILLDAGRWSGAYYLVGYAVEDGLKACIIKRLMATDAFPEKRYSERCYTHDLNELVKLAGLLSVLDTARADQSFNANWEIAIKWSEQTRYHFMDEFEARKMFEAVTDPTNGVLPWLKMLW